MARTALTPLTLTPDNSAQNLTALAATVTTGAGAGNGVSFANAQGVTLLVNAPTGSNTATVLVGTTVDGQPVTSETVTLTASAINEIGPFRSVLDQPGTTQVLIDFSVAVGAGLRLQPGVA